LDFAREKQVQMAVFSVIGSLKQAKLGYYDQGKRKYLTIKLDRPLEIASCLGNLSFKDGKPFLHAHSVLSDAKGKTCAGHLITAKVFAAELHFQELLGRKLEREQDQTTGLSLWDLGRR
jgi:predicted DNA-binding protein with PD1-like motif